MPRTVAKRFASLAHNADAIASKFRRDLWTVTADISGLFSGQKRTPTDLSKMRALAGAATFLPHLRPKNFVFRPSRVV